MLIRFGTVTNDAPLSEIVSPPLGDEDFKPFADSLLESDTCQLRNGHTFSIQLHQGQPFPYGAGGASPDQFFSLTMDNRKLYYHHIYYQGRTQDRYTTSALMYKNGRLSECEPAYPDDWSLVNQQPHIPPSRCRDVSARISGDMKNFTLEEKQFYDKDKARNKLTAKLSDFCKNYHAAEIYDEAAFNNESAANIIINTYGLVISAREMDFFKDRKKELLIRVGSSADDCIGCGNRAFDGNYFIIAPSDSPYKNELLNLLKSKDFNMNLPKATVQKIQKWGGHVLPAPIQIEGEKGMVDRYAHTKIMEIHEKHYVDSTSNFMESVPSRTMSLIRPDFSTQPTCLFP